MMTDHDDHIRNLLVRASGSPALAAREDLLDTLMTRLDAGGDDVAEAPLPGPRLATVPGGSPVRSRTVRGSARWSGVGMAGIVLLAVGTAAAASVSAWLALTPQAPVAPVIAPVAPSEDPLTVPPVVSPNIESVTGSALEPVLPPLAGFHSDEAALPATLDELPSALSPTDVALADVLGPVISSVSVGELSGSVLDILMCATSAPLSANVTDDSEVAAVTVRITALGVADTSVPLAKTGAQSWTGAVGGLRILQAVPLDAVASVTVEAVDVEGNSSTSHTSVPLHHLVCG